MLLDWASLNLTAWGFKFCDFDLGLDLSSCSERALLEWRQKLVGVYIIDEETGVQGSQVASWSLSSSLHTSRGLVDLDQLAVIHFHGSKGGSSTSMKLSGSPKPKQALEGKRPPAGVLFNPSLSQRLRRPGGWVGEC